MSLWFDVPSSLRAWFVVHFVVGLAVGLPLLVVPGSTLALLAWLPGDPGVSRLLGAAWVALGVASWRTRGANLEVVRAMLGLKSLWSGLGIFAALGAIGQGAPGAAWVMLFLFLVFAGVWLHYAILFRRLEAAGPLTFDPRADEERAADPASVELPDDPREGEGAPGPTNER